MKYKQFWQEHLNRCRLFKNVEFPFNNLRAGQKKMMSSILKSLFEKELLFIHAPTGIGKTLASIYPAIKALSTLKYTHILYLTAKTSTRLEVKKALLQLYEKKFFDLCAIFLEPADELCPHHRFCPPIYTLDKDLIKDALNELLNKKPKKNTTEKPNSLDESQENTLNIIDSGRIKEVATFYNLCPYQLMQEALVYCEIIVGDYNHIIDPFVRLKNLLDYKECKSIWLIDEAHNIVERARKNFSYELKLSSFHNLWQRLKTLEKVLDLTQTKELIKSIIDYFKDLISHKDDLENLKYFTAKEVKKESEDLVFALPNYRSATYKPTYFLNICQKLYENLKIIHKSIDDVDLIQLLYEKIYDLNVFIYLANSFWREGFLVEAHFKNTDIIIALSCLDVSTILEEFYKPKHQPIFFSGSLQPLNYYRNTLCDLKKSTPSLLEIESPFPKENLCILQANFLKSDYQNRENSILKLIKTIEVALNSKKGKYLVFFPSFNFLEKVHKNWLHFASDKIINNYTLVVQKRNQSNNDASLFLDTFKNNPKTPTIGFAVLGGGFAEGIDLPNNTLKGVIIVGLGLAQPSPHLEILKSYYDFKMGDGFFYTYRCPGFNKLLQAAGRVIRSENDTGFILFSDERLNSYHYEYLWPPHFKKIQIMDLEEMKKVLHKFWQEVDPE